MVDRGTLHASRRNAILEASGDTAYSTACRRRRDRAQSYGSHVGGPTCSQAGPCSERAQAAEWEGRRPHGRSAAFRSAGERRQPARGKKRAPASRPRRRENEHHRPQRTAASAASRRGWLHRRAAARRTAFHLQRNGFSQRRQCIAAGGRDRRAPARAHAARRTELDAHRRAVVSLSPGRRTPGRRRGARARSGKARYRAAQLCL